MDETIANPFEGAMNEFSADPAVTPGTTGTETETSTETNANTDAPAAKADDELTLLEVLDREFSAPGDTGDTDDGEETETQENGEASEAEKQAAAAKEEAEQEEQVKKEMGVKAHERFKEIKTTLKSITSERDALKAELERAKITGKVTGGEEVDTIKAELKKAQDRLAMFDVETSPEYQEQVAKPLGVITDFVEGVAKNFGLDADDLIDALRQPDEKAQTTALDALLKESGVPDRVRLRIYQAANDLPHIWAKRDELRGNASEALKELEARRKEDGEAATKATLQKHADALNEVWDNVELAVLRSLPTADIKAIREQVAGVKVGEMPPKATAFALYSAVLMPQLQKRITELAASEAALKQKLARVKGAQPGAGGGKNTQPTPVADENLSFAEAIERGFAQA